jgi:hypothetical protein
MSVDLKFILEATVFELRELIDSPDLEQKTIVGFYANILLAYRLGRMDALQDYLKRFETLPLSQAPEKKIRELVGSIITVRHQIYSRDVHPLSIEALETLLPTIEAPLWRAETHFVIALSYASIEKEQEAQQHYKLANHFFSQAEAPKRAVAALLNCVSAESRLFPETIFITDYMYVAAKALQIGESPVAGTAYLNVSRDYQKLEAFQAALFYCNLAIQNLENQRGSINFDLALAHRAHLLINVDRKVEAQALIESLLASPFEEVQGAIGVLYKKMRMSPKRRPFKANAKAQAWNDRRFGVLEFLKTGSGLSPMENKILDLLFKKPYSKFELAAETYGDRLDCNVTLNRLNNVIFRLRKRFPNLIVIDEGTYRISHETALALA